VSHDNNSAEKRAIQVFTISGRVIDLSIDSDGDLVIEDDEGNRTLYISSGSLHGLRDWLNKVIP